MGGDRVFMKNKYVLTYEMKILYCPDVDLNLACKELNLSTLQFMLYDGDREDLNNGFELYPNEVTTIAESILMGKVGYELDSKQMEWIEKYETRLKKDISLILNKTVTYNYFILKLQLLGFNESVAREIVYHYYKQMEENRKVAHPQIFLKNINLLLKQKIFWVKKDLEHEMIAEEAFLRKVIKSKFEQQYKFSFDTLYKDEYMNLLKKGIVHTLMQFNLHQSYLVKKKQQVTNLVPYVLKVYRLQIKNILNNIYEKYYNVTPNTGFIEDLLNQMESAIRLYIAISFK